MKKLLLALAATSLATGAWAKTYNEAFPQAPELDPTIYTDYTPAYYKFYKGETDLDAMVRGDLVSPDAPHMGKGKFISTNLNQGENHFTTEGLKNGNLMIGAWAKNNNKTKEMCEQSFSLYNFGGKIGEVFVFNTKNSGLGEAIKEEFNLDEAPVIPSLDANIANTQQFWIYDHVTMNSSMPAGDQWVHVRVELNAYHNNMTTSANAVSHLMTQDEEGNATFNNGAINTFVYYKDFVKCEGDLQATINPDSEFDETPTTTWNPYRWMVLDFNVPYKRMAGFFKISNAGGTIDHNNSALLIRSIEIYGLNPEDAPLEENKVRVSYKDYNPVIAAVEDITAAPAENVAPKFYNLQGVEVATPAAGNVYIKVVGDTATKVLVK